MKTPTPALTLYNASAGSGKTYTLVKAYLKIALSDRDPHAFRHILAITFTNKAANEMKNRILSALQSFSQGDASREGHPFHPLFSAIKEESGLPAKRLVKQAQGLLHSLLHDYANFHIRTIDGFNHRLIRSFAKDLEIPGNFSVELDSDRLVSAIAERTLNRIGTEAFTTSLLIDFSAQRLAQGKSWKPQKELQTVIKTLFEEKSTRALRALAAKDRKDFIALRDQLLRYCASFKEQLQQRGTAALELIAQSGIAAHEWVGGKSGLTKYFGYLEHFQPERLLPSTRIQRSIAQGKWHAAKAGADFQHRFQAIRGALTTLYEQVLQQLQQGYQTYLKNQLILENFAVFALIQSLESTLKTIEAEEAILPIAEFNARIDQAVRDTPTPFLYERLGTIFQHFFIDEFQDTSRMQFDNLLPLLEEALSRPGSSVNLMGDPKQSIYRWRGANPEHLLQLEQQRKPYPIKSETLAYNYRSRSEIIHFNNGLFRFAAQQLSLPQYQERYANSAQKPGKPPATQEGGHVAIHLSAAYANRTFEAAQLREIQAIIHDLMQRGFAPSDICILLRSKREISTLSDFLTQQGLHVATSESLLLKNNPTIRLLHCLLHLIREPDDPLARAQLIEHLHASTLVDIADLYQTQQTLSNCEWSVLQNWLDTHHIHLPLDRLAQLPLLEQVFSLLHALKLPQHDAFINFFLDEVFTFTRSHPRAEADFPAYWEAHSDKFSIVSDRDPKAIKIMTIHKAKGLEFPAVICPVVSNAKGLQIDKESDWFPLDAKAYQGFTAFYSTYKNKLKAVYPEQYQARKNQVEFDSLNLLYVSFTRAIEELHILTHDQNRYLAGHILGFLEQIGVFKAGQKRYSFGKKVQKTQTNNPRETTAQTVQLTAYPTASWRGRTNEPERERVSEGRYEALEQGNTLHYMLRGIHSADQVRSAVRQAVQAGMLPYCDSTPYEKKLREVVEHPLLSPYFSKGCYSLNERDILHKDTHALRPDRIVLDADRQAVILDYKTGKPQAAHHEQLSTYAKALEEVGLPVRRALLVYLGDAINVQTAL